MKLVEIKATRFKLQYTDNRSGSKEWKDLVPEEFSREEAQEFLDGNYEDADLYRAVGVNGGETLTRTKGHVPEPNPGLARDAKPDVHKRNEDFFKKHLG